MINETELIDRLLSELEEAGVDNVAALSNTVLRPSGSAAELANLSAAFSGIVRAGDARCEERSRANPGTRRSLTMDDALETIGALGDLLSFSPSERMWRHTSDRTLDIVLTDQGYARSVRILEERGHNWWVLARS